MTLHAGKMNRKITVQHRLRVFDSCGQMIDAWEDLCSVWAWVKSAAGAAYLPTSDGVGRDIVKYSFRVRYNPRIKADMRIVYLGEYYEISDVLHDIAGHEYTDIVANHGGANG